VENVYRLPKAQRSNKERSLSTTLHWRNVGAVGSILSFVFSMGTQGIIRFLSIMTIKARPHSHARMEHTHIVVSVFGPEGVLDQRVNAACPFPGGWCKENTRGFILVRAREGPTSSGGGEILYFLTPRCLRRGYKLAREGGEPRSQRGEKGIQDDCLRCWSLSCVWLVVRCCWSLSCVWLVVRCLLQSPSLPFYRTRGGQGNGCLEMRFCRSLLGWL
jgi:hypothetical protein